MATWLVIAVTLAYAWTAGELAYRADYGHALMFFGYAIANVGLLWALK